MPLLFPPMFSSRFECHPRGFISVSFGGLSGVSLILQPCLVVESCCLPVVTTHGDETTETRQQIHKAGSPSPLRPSASRVARRAGSGRAHRCPPRVHSSRHRRGAGRPLQPVCRWHRGRQCLQEPEYWGSGEPVASERACVPLGAPAATAVTVPYRRVRRRGGSGAPVCRHVGSPKGAGSAASGALRCRPGLPIQRRGSLRQRALGGPGPRRRGFRSRAGGSRGRQSWIWSPA